jgi:hypothetical protein
VAKNQSFNNYEDKINVQELNGKKKVMFKEGSP